MYKVSKPTMRFYKFRFKFSSSYIYKAKVAKPAMRFYEFIIKV